MSKLTNAQAESVVLAAKRKAAEIGVTASIAVQDSAGHALVFSRMDGAFLASIDIAEKKARTAVLFRLESQDVWQFSKESAPAHGVDRTNGTLVTFEGGIPLRAPDNEMIGAIGVSGGSVDQDYVIAQAGAAALTNN